jgi:hypothetical protein
MTLQAEKEQQQKIIYIWGHYPDHTTPHYPFIYDVTTTKTADQWEY